MFKSASIITKNIYILYKTIKTFKSIQFKGVAPLFYSPKSKKPYRLLRIVAYTATKVHGFTNNTKTYACTYLYPLLFTLNNNCACAHINDYIILLYRCNSMFRFGNGKKCAELVYRRPNGWYTGRFDHYENQWWLFVHGD